MARVSIIIINDLRVSRRGRRVYLYIREVNSRGGREGMGLYS
jgi:hypothetical protein